MASYIAWQVHVGAEWGKQFRDGQRLTSADLTYGMLLGSALYKCLLRVL